jgi:hypothetical protein
MAVAMGSDASVPDYAKIIPTNIITSMGGERKVVLATMDVRFGGDMGWIGLSRLDNSTARMEKEYVRVC